MNDDPPDSAGARRHPEAGVLGRPAWRLALAVLTALAGVWIGALVATLLLVGRTANDVDATSGATTTSRALPRVTSAALQSAPRRDGAP